MPKVVDHVQYRKILLGQCFELFAQKGYAALTMREIAQHLGVSTGTLYHYFESKEILFEQFVEDMAERDLLQASAELSALTTVSERIQAAFAFVERHQDYFFQQMLIFMDAYQYQQRHPGETSVLAVIERVGEGVRAAIQELLGLQDPQLCVWVLSMIDGLIVSRLYGCRHVSFPTQAQICAQLLTAYLNSSPSVRSL
jgi:AcrR family transcriptional regulator